MMKDGRGKRLSLGSHLIIHIKKNEHCLTRASSGSLSAPADPRRYTSFLPVIIKVEG
jgi:hypothetical protein